MREHACGDQSVTIVFFHADVDFSHVTPSFLTGDKMECQSNFTLQVNLLEFLNYMYCMYPYLNLQNKLQLL